MAVNFPFLDPRQMAGKGLPNQTTDPRMATAAASMAPGVGDVIGLLSDASGYIQNPGSLTPAAGLLSVAGLIPGVPSMGAAKKLKKLKYPAMEAEAFANNAIEGFGVARGMAKSGPDDFIRSHLAFSKQLDPDRAESYDILQEALLRDEGIKSQLRAVWNNWEGQYGGKSSGKDISKLQTMVSRKLTELGLR